MDRRALVLSGLATLGTAACATMQPAGPGNDPNAAPPPQPYTMDEIVAQGSDFLGVAAESMGAAAEPRRCGRSRPSPRDWRRWLGGWPASGSPRW